MELFAPADFLTLTDDQRLSRQSFEEFPAGMRVAASAGPSAGPGIDAVYKWFTIFPHEPELEGRLYSQTFVGMAASVLRTGPVARAAQAHANPYLTPSDPVKLTNPGQVQVRQRDDLGVVHEAEGFMTTTAASNVVRAMVSAGGDASAFELVTAGVFV
jgi:hypothetical protein